jgi:hypothetical protein
MTAIRRAHLSYLIEHHNRDGSLDPEDSIRIIQPIRMRPRDEEEVEDFENEGDGNNTEEQGELIESVFDNDRNIIINELFDVKDKLLSTFHVLFETQLSLSDSNNNKIGSELWLEFISSAKDLLLAYSLVSMLPVSL